ncbi:MAG: hypothetical protein RR239_00985 [Oscillospiraceae bacterium]
MEVTKSISKFGRKINILDGAWKSRPFKAFIQPLRYKNKMYLNGNFTPIGRDSTGYFLYIGPISHSLSALSTSARIVDSDNHKYSVERSETVYFKDKPFYIWAVIRETVDEKI